MDGSMVNVDKRKAVSDKSDKSKKTQSALRKFLNMASSC